MDHNSLWLAVGISQHRRARFWLGVALAYFLSFPRREPDSRDVKGCQPAAAESQRCLGRTSRSPTALRGPYRQVPDRSHLVSLSIWDSRFAEQASCGAL